MSDQTSIDTVVFDLGGVLIRWDPRFLYERVFADADEMEWFLSEVTHPEWNGAQDAGRSWDEAAREAIARHPAYAEQIEAYRARWHEMVPGAIEGTVRILEELDGAGTPLYAITNWAEDTFEETRTRFAFLGRFRDIVVSGRERLIKPDPRIFRLLAERAGVDLTRSVFIDDSEKNVRAARDVGMTALHFTSPEMLRQDLRGLGFAIPG
jgi:2-haloacid dehalogenase